MKKDYICISDIAKAKSDKSRAADVIRNCLRNRSTLDFLTAWEQLYNPNFKVFESEHFRKQVGLLTKNNYLIHTDAIKNYILPDSNYYRNILNNAEKIKLLGDSKEYEKQV